MIYYLTLPQLGYSKKVKSVTGTECIKVIAEVELEFDLYRVDDNLLFTKDDRHASIIAENLYLPCIKGYVQVEQFQGSSSDESPRLFNQRLFEIPVFENTVLIGRYKKQLFCTETARLVINEINCGVQFIEVQNDDLKSFLWSGEHLTNVSTKMKEMLLKGLRNNWDYIE
jgi:hypothetical protein